MYLYQIIHTAEGWNRNIGMAFWVLTSLIAGAQGNDKN
jgi:hypothetical protein